MAKKQTSRNHQGTIKEKRSPARNVWLMLTLVPLIVGVLLIFAWAMDFQVLKDLQVQLFVGVFFFLLSFAASNLLQERRNLAAGWGLLMAADVILLGWLNLWAQIAAILVGAAGLGFILVEFYRQYQQGGANRPAK